MKIKIIETGHYRIPLPMVLSDSTHGDISHFELIVVKLTSDDDSEGIGYTYTVGSGGSAVQALIQKDLAPLLDVVEASLCREGRHRRLFHICSGYRFVGSDSQKRKRTLVAIPGRKFESGQSLCRRN